MKVVFVTTDQALIGNNVTKGKTVILLSLSLSFSNPITMLHFASYAMIAVIKFQHHKKT